MSKVKNKACALKVGQIEKNPILSLSVGERDIEKYARVAKAYGNVTPAIVSQNGNSYQVLAGQAGLLACAKSGMREMPAIITEVNSEAERMKLALLLSTVREEGGPLSEGAFIDALITRHGVTRRELAVLLKKSKSWISKRHSLILKLSDDLKGMVKDGTICARTAEEIAKLPESAQFIFANNVVRDSLNKTDVGYLVSLYTREVAGSALREAIISSPLAVLDTQAATPVAPRRKEKRSLAEQIAGKIGFICRLMHELEGMLYTTDNQSLLMVASHLFDLKAALTELNKALDKAVSPGKQGGNTPEKQGGNTPEKQGGNTPEKQGGDVC